MAVGNIQPGAPMWLTAIPTFAYGAGTIPAGGITVLDTLPYITVENPTQTKLTLTLQFIGGESVTIVLSPSSFADIAGDTVYQPGFARSIPTKGLQTITYASGTGAVFYYSAGAVMLS